MFAKLQDWILGGYDSEVREINRAVVARFARGNIRVQEGRYADEAESKSLKRRGHKALEYLCAQM
jgi:hypothetical protein